jgi:phenylalanyl-tRNA synthetase beta subunit
MVFRHPERTLTGEEVDRAVKSVLGAAVVRFGAKLRA